MKHWIMLFTPETYELVKKHSTIGVRSNVWKSFSENMKVGDRFIGYVSRQMIFDATGTITGDATFEETMLFHDQKWFPCRRRVKFEKTGLNKPSSDLFHGVAPFNEVNTGPGNYLMCKGGFVEVSKKDFDWLCGKLGL
ncbi:MAG TPA: EVE domain-containing protein [Candidatus Ozemobacteraceae bacterium]|nr:EVE domain-containing protein [Candidatus Ozemobacteraceae bacterium]